MCREHERIRHQRIQDIAFAHRVGAHASDKDWKKFLDESIVHQPKEAPARPDRYSATHVVKRKTAKRKKHGGDSKQNP
jgi:hypothetical protein